jgi:hypothetical protein
MVVERNRLSARVVDYAASEDDIIANRQASGGSLGASSKNIEWPQMHKGPRVARGPGGRIKLNIRVGATIHSAASSWCGRTTDRNADCLSN